MHAPPSKNPPRRAIVLLLKGGKPGDPGLVRKLITDKRGRQSNHWVKIDHFGPLRARQQSAQNGLQGDLLHAQGDPYQSFETRADTSERQRQAGRDALSEIERRLHRLRPGGRPAASLLGVRIARDLRAHGSACLVGQTVNSPADLAALAQVYRDPRFETFRVFYTSSSGTVVGEAAYTSRLPGAVELPQGFAADIDRDRQRYGASGYYVLHNHPSGKAEPSRADLSLTTALAKKAPGFRGHVVIDHNEYARIDADGKSQVVPAPELAGVDFYAAPALDHPLLGTGINNFLEVAEAGKRLQAHLRNGAPVLVLTAAGSVSRVNLIASVPLGLMDAAHQRHHRAKAWLRGLGRESGSGGHVFLATTRGDMRTGGARYLRMIEAGLVTDVVDEDGKSLRASSLQGVSVQTQSASEIFGARRGGMKVAQEAQAPDSFAATEKTYGGRAAYDRAKAAGKTKLAYGQWVQVRTPRFKAWFGDWQALRAQERLDAMEPIKVRVPDAWRGMDHAALRQKMAKELDRMVRERVDIAHPDIGIIRVGRAGAKKSQSTARDPAKMLVTADLESLIPTAIYARSTQPTEKEQGVDGYSTLLTRVIVDGMPLVASFSIRQQRDGAWYYNAVALYDENETARDSYGPSGALSRPLDEAPIAGLHSFIRRPLERVNPETVSKVVDPQTGEPLLVYHGTTSDFSQFDMERAGAVGERFVDAAFFTTSPTVAGGYAQSLDADSKHKQLMEAERDAMSAYGASVAKQFEATGTTIGGAVDSLKAAFDAATKERQDRRKAIFSNDAVTPGGNIMPTYLSLQNPVIIDAKGANYHKVMLGAFAQAEENGADGIIVRNVVDAANEYASEPSDVFIAFEPTQIKSATGNNGDFDPVSPVLTKSRRPQVLRIKKVVPA